MATTAITGVRTVAVPVNNQDQALTFYTDLLGFEKRLDAPVSDALRWIEVAPPKATTSLALVATPRGTDSGIDTGVRFAVADAATEHARMATRGVTVGDMLHWDGVPPTYTFTDPDGNRFYVVQHEPGAD